MVGERSSTHPSSTPVVDGYGIVVHSGSGRDVDTVVVDGRARLRAGRPVGFDGHRIGVDAQAVADRQWRRHGTRPVTGTKAALRRRPAHDDMGSAPALAARRRSRP